MRFWLICLAAALLAAAPSLPATAASAAPASLDKLQRADGVLVVPERFLRRWDPVTVSMPAPPAAAPRISRRNSPQSHRRRRGPGNGSGRAYCSSARPSRGNRCAASPSPRSGMRQR